MVIIGIVGFQGDVSEHIEAIERLSKKDRIDVKPIMVKSVEDLEKVDGLIIPGGESTTIYKLLKQYSIFNAIKDRISNGMPVMGTCAGIILLSRDTGDDRVEGMGALDAVVSRNAYGRQIDSFIDEIDIKGVGKFRAVFIRAPAIDSTGDVEILSEYRGKAVMIRKEKVLGMTFHPELTEDIRIHRLFTDMIGGGGSSSTGKK